jgi:hypothetical protein
MALKAEGDGEEEEGDEVEESHLLTTTIDE